MLLLTIVQLLAEVKQRYEWVWLLFFFADEYYELILVLISVKDNLP